MLNNSNPVYGPVKQVLTHLERNIWPTYVCIIFHLPESTMDLPGLLDSFKQNTKLLQDLSLVNKVILCIVAFLGLCIFMILTERFTEHRPYKSRKLWIGRSQRILGRKMPPVGIALPMRNENAQSEESVIWYIPITIFEASILCTSISELLSIDPWDSCSKAPISEDQISNCGLGLRTKIKNTGCTKIRMVILKLLQFIFISFVVITPLLCAAYIAIKMGWCDNRPGNVLTAVFSYTACCLTACISLCQRNRRNTDTSETVWTPCCSALLTQAHTLACSPPHSHTGAGPGQS